MADNPIPTPLPADLPTNWVYGQTVAPTGAEAGLATQYGYNYLMAAVNAAQAAINLIGTAFESLPELDGGKIPVSQLPAGVAGGVASLDQTGKVPTSQLPAMNYLPLAGGTMKGAINMAGFPVSGLVDPVVDDHAARKAYVDAQVSTKARMKTGSYVGNGQSTVTVAIGFYPKVVVFWAPDAGYDAPLTFSLAVYAGQSQDQIYNVGATELITRTYSVSGTNLVVSTINYPASFALNEQGRVYKFFALG